MKNFIWCLNLKAQVIFTTPKPVYKFGSGLLLHGTDQSYLVAQGNSGSIFSHGREEKTQTLNPENLHHPENTNIMTIKALSSDSAWGVNIRAHRSQRRLNHYR